MKVSTYLLIAVTIFSISACKKDNPESPKKTITIEVPPKENNAINTPTTEFIPTFQINEYFEAFIKKNNTTSDMVNIDKPKMGSELLRKGDKLKLEINGYWVNNKATATDKLTLEIFPSSFKQNDGNRPMIEQKLSLKKENKYLIFGYLNHVSLEEGLYYYFLKNGKMIVYTGNFVVK
jgi:hypothetical protein